MNKTKLPASRFRLDFPKLIDEVEVTVHGRVIGRYIPRPRLEEMPILRGDVDPKEIARG